MSNRPVSDDMESWLDRMNREFREAARMWGEATDPWTPTRDRPAIDLEERDDTYVLRADLPGFTKDDIEVRAVDDTLVIDADRDETEDETDANYVRRERHRHSMARRVTFSEPIDAENVDASMRHGVLTVTIPKVAAVEEGTKIEID